MIQKEDAKRATRRGGEERKERAVGEKTSISKKKKKKLSPPPPPPIPHPGPASAGPPIDELLDRVTRLTAKISAMSTGSPSKGRISGSNGATPPPSSPALARSGAAAASAARATLTRAAATAAAYASASGGAPPAAAAPAASAAADRGLEHTRTGASSPRGRN